MCHKQSVLHSTGGQMGLLHAIQQHSMHHFLLQRYHNLLRLAPLARGSVCELLPPLLTCLAFES